MIMTKLTNKVKNDDHDFKIAAQTVVDGGFMPAGNVYERKQGLVIYYLNADQGPTNPLA